MKPVRLLLVIAAVTAQLLTYGQDDEQAKPRVAAVKWWKGNLHTHSLWSDGDDYPEMIATWYKSHGYQFLALSDHNIMADHERWIGIEKSKGGKHAYDRYVAQFGDKWVEGRDNAKGVREVRLKMLSEFRTLLEEPEQFLMIPSEEISARFLTAPIHLNATNLKEKIAPPSGNNIVDVIQKCVDAVLEQRARTGQPMMVHLNHPNFGWAITAEELMQVERERFFEVYNGHPLVHNSGDARRAGTERVWDIILTKRLAELDKEVIYGLATDDAHNYHAIEPEKPAEDTRASKAEPSKESNAKPDPDAAQKKKASRPGRGWVMVRAEKLEAGSLISALEAGDFYASTGVTLRDVKRGVEEYSVEIAPEAGISYKTEFIGTRTGYDRESQPVLGNDGTVLRVTRRYSKDIGVVLSVVEGPNAVYRLRGDEIYVRARITSSKPKVDPPEDAEFERAWTQPVVTGVK